MSRVVVLFFCLLLVCFQVVAQRKSPRPKFDARKNAAEQKELAVRAKDSRAKLIEATNSYKEALQKKLEPLREQEKIWTGKIQKIRESIELGLLAKNDRGLQEAAESLQNIQSEIKSTEKNIVTADQFVVEIMNLDSMAKTQRVYQAPNVYFDNLRYIRYTGTAAWSLRGYSLVENFFQGNFRRALPLSAFGQSETHNRLGFDHSNSFDVALHPDTTEARTLMSYLRSRGIPFTAFRGAIPGNATGAHIHIGYPSHRFR